MTKATKIFFFVFSSVFVLSCSSPTEKPPVHDSFPGDSAAKVVVRDSIMPVPPPRIVQRGGRCMPEIHDSLFRIIHQLIPGFQIWNDSDFVQSCNGRSNWYQCTASQLPYLVVADFNGDSISDAVMLGRDAKEEMLVALLSSSGTYTAQKIRSQPLTNPNEQWEGSRTNKGLYSYLLLLDKEHYSYRTPVKKIKHAAFLYETCGKANELFWLEKGVFLWEGFGD